ncbi:MAG: LysM peptidoglycan-binding domain-containing protein [Elusimicrobia bacterium]|nr:LysM peptidoglycan-binding domain-containing protein [Elusimicrobiota bacterium]
MKKIVLAAALSGGLALPAWPAQRHTVKKNECLWNLAKKYYGDPFLWEEIARANDVTVKNPELIFPGQMLVVPGVEEKGEKRPSSASSVFAQEEDDTIAQSGAAAAAPDDISSEMPPAMAGQYPSLDRFKAPAGWARDGEVVEFEGREAMSAEGDMVTGKLLGKAGVSKGHRLGVYRRDAPQELDEDQDALYLQRVGRVEVREDLGGGRWKLLILKSSDAVQVGDWLRRFE